MRELLQNIFSISDYGETHHILRLCGLKIKFPKLEYAKKQKENPYYYYKKNNIDITTIPPATGQIRDIQLANLALLKELDYVCRENGLKYWLDGGTLLGAVRHKGYIPWDDDVDVAMMRDDYNKLIEAFNKSTNNPYIYADYVYLGIGQSIIKVMHRKCPMLFVDIFPYDYVECNNDTERISFNNKLKKYRKTISKNKKLNSIDKVKQEILKFNSENTDNISGNCNSISCGMEYKYIRPVLVQAKDVIFPVKTIEFEGSKFMCPNNHEKLLSYIYKDYMSNPKKIGYGHFMFKKISDTNKKIIEDLIKWQNNL